MRSSTVFIAAATSCLTACAALPKIDNPASLMIKNFEDTATGFTAPNIAYGCSDTKLGSTPAWAKGDFDNIGATKKDPIRIAITWAVDTDDNNLTASVDAQPVQNKSKITFDDMKLQDRIRKTSEDILLVVAEGCHLRAAPPSSPSYARPPVELPHGASQTRHDEVFKSPYSLAHLPVALNVPDAGPVRAALDRAQHAGVQLVGALHAVQL